jgi:hypothetical protein
MSEDGWATEAKDRVRATKDTLKYFHLFTHMGESVFRYTGQFPAGFEPTDALEDVPDSNNPLASRHGSPTREPMANGSSETPVTVRAAVRRFLKENRTFEVDQAFDAVREWLPNAKTGTIRAELSHAKTRGHAEQGEGRVWISHVTTDAHQECLEPPGMMTCATPTP